MTNPVLIIGAGKLGRIALDAFYSNDVLVYGFLDDNKELHNTEISNILVLGEVGEAKYLNIIGDKTEYFVAVENRVEKKSNIEEIKDERKTMPTNAIHKAAIVSEDAEVGYGILVAAGAVVNPGVQLNNYSVIHANAAIDVDAVIGEYAEIGTGAIINTEAEIGEGAFIGSGAIVISGVKIGKDARVGAGSVVISDVPKGKTVFGNPAMPVDK